MRQTIAAAVFCLAGCAGGAAHTAASNQPPPASGYPSLHDVPRSNDANTDAAYWAQVQRELLAAGQELRASPRSQAPAEPEDPAAFATQAHEELEATRRSHEPN